MQIIPGNYHEMDNIFSQAALPGIHSLAVCGPSNGCGVSLLSMSLANRAAQAGLKVLLVEFNLLNPKMASALHIHRHNWLPLENEWQYAVEHSSSEGVDLLCAPLETADNVAFRDVVVLRNWFMNLQAHYDLVVCDNSPICNRNQNNIPAHKVCSACDHTLITVMSGVTTESKVEEAKDVLKSAGVGNLSAVMNDRYAPSLKTELLRETQRLERWMPGLMARLRRYMDNVLLLNQEL